MAAESDPEEPPLFGGSCCSKFAVICDSRYCLVSNNHPSISRIGTGSNLEIVMSVETPRAYSQKERILQ